MSGIPLIVCLFLCACAAKSPLPAPSLVADPSPSPETVQKAEWLRAEGMELLFSKDPSIKNPKLAYEKFKAAAALGDPVSMDQLGAFHSTGLAGVEKSCPKAIEWFSKAADGGYPLAMNNLAFMLVTCPDKKRRDPERAEALVKTLFQSMPSMLALLDTYASVQAEQGDFKGAQRTLSVVIDLTTLADGNPEKVDEMKRNLALYQKGKKPKTD